MKIPNYVDDVQDFEQFDDAEAMTYTETAVPTKDDDEIEYVLGHCRDEGHEHDPEDDWGKNIVGAVSRIPPIYSKYHPAQAFPHQMEELLTST